MIRIPIQTGIRATTSPTRTFQKTEPEPRETGAVEQAKRSNLQATKNLIVTNRIMDLILRIEISYRNLVQILRVEIPFTLRVIIMKNEANVDTIKTITLAQSGTPREVANHRIRTVISFKTFLRKC